MNSEKREQIAQELAAKDGQRWEGLRPERVSAYLHDADVFIEQGGWPPVDKFTGKPVYTCDRCKDKAYIGEKRCMECNPVGLPAAQVHPQIESRPDDSEEGEEELFARRQADAEAEEVRKTRVLKPSEYRCSKCSKPGKTVIHFQKKSGTGIGQKHLEFRV